MWHRKIKHTARSHSYVWAHPLHCPYGRDVATGTWLKSQKDVDAFIARMMTKQTSVSDEESDDEESDAEREPFPIPAGSPSKRRKVAAIERVDDQHDALALEVDSEDDDIPPFHPTDGDEDDDDDDDDDEDEEADEDDDDDADSATAAAAFDAKRIPVADAWWRLNDEWGNMYKSANEFISLEKDEKSRILNDLTQTAYQLGRVDQWEGQQKLALIAQLSAEVHRTEANVMLIGGGIDAAGKALGRLDVAIGKIVVFETDEDCVANLKKRYGNKVILLENLSYRASLGDKGASAEIAHVSRTDLQISGSMYFVSPADIKRISEEIGGIQLVVVSTECQGISLVNTAGRSFAHHSRVQAYNAAHIIDLVQKYNARPACGSRVAARFVPVVSEMVLAEHDTNALGHATMGIGAVEINAAQFGATARARNFSTNFPLRDEINEDDIGPLTLDACVCKADPAFKANVRGRTDGKIGTLKKTGVFRGTKVRVDDMSAKPDAFPVDINDLELVMGFDVGDTDVEGVSKKRRKEQLGNSIHVYVMQHILRVLVEDGWLPQRA